MKIFSTLYEKVMSWSRHQYASRYLAALSFAESSFFPIPPDVMLAPMSMARPDKALYYATITTLASVVGGILGYFIGSYAFEWIHPFMIHWGYEEKLITAQQWFDEWGFWAIFIAGFSPIPYKVFTITAGIISMSFLPFVVASFIGRGARFYLVASLMAKGGEKMEKKLKRYVDLLGWLMIVLIVGVVFYVKH